MSERQFDWRTPVIAIDFDGCLCADDWPEIGPPNNDIIDQAIRCQKDGACLVLWTCREDELLKAAVEACRKWGLEFDYINENPKFRIDLYGNDCRKIGADEYWDDRSVWMGRIDGFRNIRGASVQTRSRKRIRQFIDEVMKPETDYAYGLSRCEDARAKNYYENLYGILREATDQMELMWQLLQERNEAHAWYKEGYNDATQNAARWVSEMVESMQREEGEPKCE